VRLTKWAGFPGLASLVNGVLRSILREGLEVEYPDREHSPEAFLAAFYSHPRWLVRKWLDRFGPAETEELLEANNRRPPLMARVNLLRTTPSRLVEMAGADPYFSCRVSNACSGSVELQLGCELAGLTAFREGLFTIQDTASTLVGLIPAVEPGFCFLDLCAAPGGKCTHIAERSENMGTLVAVDSSFERMALLIRNRARLGLDSILSVLADGRNFHAKGFDLVLVDAPCTGTGVLSRRADLRWRLSEEDLTALPRVQSSLLDNASTLVKTGGYLLYSTCSLEPEENTAVIETFLAERGEFSLEMAANVDPDFVSDTGCFHTFPHRHSMDGMFACLMVRS